MTPKTRYEIPDLVSSSQDQTIIGVEIGTDQGLYAAQLLKKYPNLYIITVDPWLPYKEIVNPAGEIDDRTLARVEYKKTMVPYVGRYTHVEQDSVAAARSLRLGSVWSPEPPYDFVFIDAAHDYGSVQMDLEAWWPLVKVGGVLSGHDLDIPDVSRAVIQFAKSNRLNLQVINEHGGPVDEGRYPGTGVDHMGTWARPSWFWYKEGKTQ